MTINDVDREEIEFVCKTIGCRPIASLDHFTAENLASADTVEEINASGSRLVKITGIANQGRTVSIMVRGSNKLVLSEAERSLHDALCVVRCLVKEKYGSHDLQYFNILHVGWDYL
jgi:T-complex protein 1 subunit delta